MKMTVTGVSASAPGAISKAGKAYRRGEIYTTSPLAVPFAEGGIEKGYRGITLECDPEIVRRIAHLPFAQGPIVCDVELELQVRFGEKVTVVIDVKPLEVKKVA